MYCVYCGVRLQDGAPECPLCHTKVTAVPVPEQLKESSYSDRYPRLEKHSGKFLAIGLVTVILIAAALGCLIFCLKSTGKVGWSGIAALGMALGWIWAILPLLFPRWRPMIFLPIDFACLGGYLLYICANTGGNWFLSFAFPVTMLAGLLTTASVALFCLGKPRRLLKTGALLIAIGCSTMLIELFQCITFGGRMFAWSLYPVCAFSLIGLFLILSGLIPPWREYLERKLFV